jgi:hypothetical protein
MKRLKHFAPRVVSAVRVSITNRDDDAQCLVERRARRRPHTYRHRQTTHASSRPLELESGPAPARSGNCFLNSSSIGTPSLIRVNSKSGSESGPITVRSATRIIQKVVVLLSGFDAPGFKGCCFAMMKEVFQPTANTVGGTTQPQPPELAPSQMAISSEISTARSLYGPTSRSS